MDYFIALDVGGTTIQAGAWDARLNGPSALCSAPSRAEESAEAILAGLRTVIGQVWNGIGDPQKRLAGIGIGFPGPFDYGRGVSRMRGLSKFERIYGFPLGDALRRDILGDPGIACAGGFRIRFENDAAVFAMGVYERLRDTLPRRLVCLTLGTGCGSVFLDGGRPVRGRDGVPEDGMIYHVPFHGATVDDVISKRGILALAARLGLSPRLGVDRLAAQAKQGDPECRKVFRRFGRLLGEAVQPYFTSFRPGALVLGGNIARACPLFRESLRETLGGPPPAIVPADPAEAYALLGAAALVRHTEQKAREPHV